MTSLKGRVQHAKMVAAMLAYGLIHIGLYRICRPEHPKPPCLAMAC